ncbi:MAG: hypothetical protein KDN19_17360 [Verrucomicrobiae bacterium]|nr:hypothetical protein [Verrucomicrobiae bacterium]
MPILIQPGKHGLTQCFGAGFGAFVKLDRIFQTSNLEFPGAAVVFPFVPGFCGVIGFSVLPYFRLIMVEQEEASDNQTSACDGHQRPNDPSESVALLTGSRMAVWGNGELHWKSPNESLVFRQAGIEENRAGFGTWAENPVIDPVKPADCHGGLHQEKPKCATATSPERLRR